MNPKTKEVLVDGLMMLCLFYIVAHPKTYAFTTGALKNLNKNMKVNDPVFLHALVFALVYISIQKITKKF